MNVHQGQWKKKNKWSTHLLRCSYCLSNLFWKKIDRNNINNVQRKRHKVVCISWLHDFMAESEKLHEIYKNKIFQNCGQSQI